MVVLNLEKNGKPMMPSTVPTIPEGATGFGVRLLNQMVADKYEG